MLPFWEPETENLIALMQFLVVPGNLAYGDVKASLTC